MTTPAERDDAIERLLRAMPADSAAGAPGACLDADVLALWAEGALSREELAAVMGHASTCGRCQAVLAAMVRSEPARVRPRGRFAWTLVRWAVPLSAAAALALWMAVDRDVVSPPTSQSVEQAQAKAPTEPPASSNAQSRDVGTLSTPRAASTPSPRERDESAARPKSDAAADTAARKDYAVQSAPELQDARVTASPPPTVTAAPPSAANPAPPSSATPAAPPPAASDSAAKAPAAAAETAREIPTAPQGAAEQIPGGGLTESVATTNTRETRNLVARRAQGQLAWIDVPSPDPLVRWRFTPTGMVERSADGGVSWTRETTGATAPLLAGRSPLPSVCWIVGRAGTVLRFTSQSGWQRFTVRAVQDPVAIDATDAVNATITLANGQRVTTTDGGVSWRRADNHGHN